MVTNLEEDKKTKEIAEWGKEKEVERKSCQDNTGCPFIFHLIFPHVGFFHLGTISISSQNILCCGGYLGNCRMLTSMLSFYPLNVGSAIPPAVTAENTSRQCLMSQMEQNYSW